jgi:hypothetical protein
MHNSKLHAAVWEAVGKPPPTCESSVGAAGLWFLLDRQGNFLVE